MRWIGFFLISCFLVPITKDLGNSVIVCLLGILGGTLVWACGGDREHKDIYLITLSCYLLYLCFLTWYKSLMGYDYLQSLDGHVVYLPYTLELHHHNSPINLIEEIFSTPKFAFVGSILVIFVSVAKISTVVGADLYLSLQGSIMIFAALNSAVLYSIFREVAFTKQQARLYALLSSLLSVQFLMATYIVRDMPITLSMSLLILLFLKKFSVKNLITMMLLIGFISTIRLASGLFSLFFLIGKLYLTFSSHRRYRIPIIGLAVILAVGLASRIQSSRDYINYKYESYTNKEASADDGNSTVSQFNSLPHGPRELIKAAYNQVMPIPVWRRMISKETRVEALNISNFPELSATYFRYLVLIYLVLFFYFGNMSLLGQQRQSYWILFIIAVFWMCVNSTSLGHRRVMGVYPILYIAAALTRNTLTPNTKRKIGLTTFMIFILTQILGLIYI